MGYTVKILEGGVCVCKGASGMFQIIREPFFSLTQKSISDDSISSLSISSWWSKEYASAEWISEGATSQHGYGYDAGGILQFVSFNPSIRLLTPGMPQTENC